jgi:hypothetical protein
MLTVAVPSAIMIPTGVDSATVKLSAPSKTASPRIVTLIVALVAPGANDAVPDAAVKSAPAVADPLTVLQATDEAVVDAEESVSVSVTTLLEPAVPSVTDASAMETAGAAAAGASAIDTVAEAGDPTTYPEPAPTPSCTVSVPSTSVSASGVTVSVARVTPAASVSVERSAERVPARRRQREVASDRGGAAPRERRRDGAGRVARADDRERAGDRALLRGGRRVRRDRDGGRPGGEESRIVGADPEVVEGRGPAPHQQSEAAVDDRGVVAPSSRRTGR